MENILFNCTKLVVAVSARKYSQQFSMKKKDRVKILTLISMLTLLQSRLPKSRSLEMRSMQFGPLGSLGFFYFLGFFSFVFSVESSFFSSVTSSFNSICSFSGVSPDFSTCNAQKRYEFQ